MLPSNTEIKELALMTIVNNHISDQIKTVHLRYRQIMLISNYDMMHLAIYLR